MINTGTTYTLTPYKLNGKPSQKVRLYITGDYNRARGLLLAMGATWDALDCVYSVSDPACVRFERLFNAGMQALPQVGKKRPRFRHYLIMDREFQNLTLLQAMKLIWRKQL